MTALAPSCAACSSIISKASSRVCSQSLLKSEILPPTMVCRLAPMVPKMERERTTIPRTTPRLRFTRKPGRSNAVVTYSRGTMFLLNGSYLAPVDLDHRRILHHDRSFQRVANPVTRGAVDG